MTQASEKLPHRRRDMVQMKLSLCFTQHDIIEVYGGLVTLYVVISVLFEDAVNWWDYTASVTEE
jgi:hypothetical protein